jgi:hypothetical protein
MAWLQVAVYVTWQVACPLLFKGWAAQPVIGVPPPVPLRVPVLSGCRTAREPVHPAREGSKSAAGWSFSLLCVNIPPIVRVMTHDEFESYCLVT